MISNDISDQARKSESELADDVIAKEYGIPKMLKRILMKLLLSLKMM